MTVLAMIFPGQGSQSIGMLSELAKNYFLVKTTFNEASTVLNYDLWKLIQQGPKEELNKTWLTQPALLSSSVAIWRIWQQQGGQIPKLMAGHSLGEYSALVCSGVLDFITAVKIVSIRGQLMQEAVPIGVGAMSAIIGLHKNIVSYICDSVACNQIVSPVNFNTPKQIVIAGHKEAVQRASIACKAAGAQYVTLLKKISVPSHCSLMKPAAEQLAKILDTINIHTPNIPVINNVDVRYEYNPVMIRQALIRQLYNPVRWTEIIKYFANQGIELLLEIGPGNVLTNLTKRIINNLSSLSINNSTSLVKAIRS